MSLHQTTAHVLTNVYNKYCVFFYLQPQCGMFGYDKCVLVHEDMMHFKDNWLIDNVEQS